jgi:hypothetical protein
MLNWFEDTNMLFIYVKINTSLLLWLEDLLGGKEKNQFSPRLQIDQHTQS